MQEFWNWLGGWAKENLTEWTIAKAYIACAVAGGAVLIGQTGLNLFGLGGDVDVDPDADVDAADADGGGLNFLSIRALASFLTFFGLVGWGGTASAWGTGPTVLAAFASGASVMFLVAWIMRFFQRMASQGNLDPHNAIGTTARVYLRIPAKGAGKGKIVVAVQGRSAEFDAFSVGPELPTGSECKVVRMTTENTFEVEPLT
jgi:hypothetical protein